MSEAAFPLDFAAAREGERPLLPLRVRDLTLVYGGASVLDGVSLDLGPSGCTVVMGPNGAGKSQLLKLLHGLIAPTTGRIDWAGQSADRARPRQALVFQKPVLLRRTVAGNIDFVLKARGKDRGRLAGLLADAELADKADRPARRLSGGEAQRLALARALATDPEVMFLDEPTASLDPASVLAIERIVDRARADGMRIVLVTHDPGQARRMADDVVFLHHGQVAEHSPADRFFDAPASMAARAYLDGQIVL